MNVDRVIDEATLDGLREIMEGAFHELIESFVKETSALFEEVVQAVEAKDHDRVSRLAHSIKSSSAMIGALRLAASAKSLEMDSRTGHTDQALLECVRRDMELACAELKRLTPVQ